MTDLPATLMDVTDEQIAKALPSFPITSIRRLQILYGTLYNLGRGLTDVSGYERYQTPKKADEDHVVVEVQIDLTGDKPSFCGVTHYDYSSELAPALGHAHNTASRGHDHSHTHRSASGGLTLAGWTVEGFTGWPDPSDPAIEAVLGPDSHPDAHVIKRLYQFGENEAAMEKIREQIEALDVDADAYLTTTRINLDPKTLDEPPAGDAGSEAGYLPGELPICNEVMRSRVLIDDFYMKADDIFSEGQGVDMSTGEPGRVVGFAEDPLKHFTTKQREKFRTLDRARSWQSHSVGETQAELLAAANEFVDACHASQYFARVYQLPYVTGPIGVDEARSLYALLVARLDADAGDTTPPAMVQFVKNQADDSIAQFDIDPEALRFWTIAQYYQQEDRRDVFRETPAAQVAYLDDLADAHQDVLDGELYGPAGFPTYDDSEDDTDWSLVNPESPGTVRAAVTTGGYFRQTFPRRQRGDDTDPKASDERLRAYIEVASGGTLDRERLLEGYIERIDQEFSGNEIPLWTISTQIAQFEALRRAGFLAGSSDTDGTDRERGNENTIVDSTPMTENTPPTDASAHDDTDQHDDQSAAELLSGSSPAPSDADKAAYRRYRLDRQLERDALADDEHAFAFGVGVLTGYVSNYQSGAEGMSRTIATQYGPEKLTVDRLKRLWVELVEKATHYGHHGMLYRDSFARVEQLQSAVDFEDWVLSRADTRFQYASGLVFGLAHNQNDTEAGIADDLDTASSTPQ